jgi:hypothetical protein
VEVYNKIRKMGGAGKKILYLENKKPNLYIKKFHPPSPPGRRISI